MQAQRVSVGTGRGWLEPPRGGRYAAIVAAVTLGFGLGCGTPSDDVADGSAGGSGLSGATGGSSGSAGGVAGGGPGSGGAPESTGGLAGIGSGGTDDAAGGAATGGGGRGATGGAGGDGAASTGGTDAGGGSGGTSEASCVSYWLDDLNAGWDLYDLVVQGEGFDAYEGQRVRLIVEFDGGVRLAADQRVVAGTFGFELTEAVSHYSNLSVYVDQNADDSCDEGEPAWGLTTGVEGCTREACVVPGEPATYYLRLPLESGIDFWSTLPSCQMSVGSNLSSVWPCPR